MVTLLWSQGKYFGFHSEWDGVLLQGFHPSNYIIWLKIIKETLYGEDIVGIKSESRGRMNSITPKPQTPTQCSFGVSLYGQLSSI